MEKERIIRGNDPSFRLAATKKRGEFFSARRGRDARKNGGGRGLRDAVGWTRTRESFSSQPREDGRREERREGGGGGIRRLRVVIIINLSGI